MNTNQIIKQAQEKIQIEIEHLSDKYVEFWEREFSGLLKEKIDGGTLGAGAKSYMIRNFIWKFMVDNWDKILDQAITQAVEEGEKRSDRDLEYYHERLQLNRDKAFDEFVKMLNNVLLSKTTPDLISAIIEDLVGEYKKIYHPIPSGKNDLKGERLDKLTK